MQETEQQETGLPETEEAVRAASERSRTMGDRLLGTGTYRFVPIIALALSLAVLTLVLLSSAASGLLPETELSGDGSTILGIDASLIWIAALGGFLGSFIKVLKGAVSDDYTGWSLLTAALYAVMRPVAGAMLGLFMLAVFASGIIGAPTGGDGGSLAGIDTDAAFIFAAAFAGGLVDGAIISLANRFINRVGGAQAAEGRGGPRA